MHLFHVNVLSVIIILLVSFVGVVVYSFSKRYMHGDARYSSFLSNMLIVLLTVILMAIADNTLMLLSLWVCCNLTLSRLIVHKSSWRAAKASGNVATQNFFIGFTSIALAFVLFYQSSGSLSIQHTVQNMDHSLSTQLGLILLLIGAMTQSAIWPFHRWLISSLNSPTPVSALMHAGVVNGGGVLLARFAPLYFSMPSLLNIIFVMGISTALLGTLWKLMQHDIKRMLACSTMGQMGFMLAQCGLGFFAAAMAHLCWHGLFKAYLFLSSGGAGQEGRLDLGYPPKIVDFILALFCGVLASFIFSQINHQHFFAIDSGVLIVTVVFIAGTQQALTILRGAAFEKLLLAIFFTSVMAALYGANVYFFESLLAPLNLIQPQPLNLLHVFGLFLLVGSWLIVLFFKHTEKKFLMPDWLLALYVKTLNSSQPHPATITAYRKEYDYV